jgi:Family of unknown function (DUF6200)
MNAQGAETPAKSTKVVVEKSAARESQPVVLIDLGKASAARVKKLRRGTGKLMGDIQAVLAELRERGEIASDYRPVVVVVERKRKSGFYSY